MNRMYLIKISFMMLAFAVLASLKCNVEAPNILATIPPDRLNRNIQNCKNVDEIALLLCETRSDVFLGFLFPMVREEKLPQVRSIIKQNGTLFFEKIIQLKNDGFREFIAQLPTKRARWCRGYFPETVKNRYPLHVFLFSCPSGLKQVLTFKDTIRKLYKKSALLKNILRSFHTTDTKSETLQVARLVFNERSLQFINTSEIFPPLEELNVLKEFVESNNCTHMCLSAEILNHLMLHELVSKITLRQLSVEQFCNNYTKQIDASGSYFFYHNLKFAFS